MKGPAFIKGLNRAVLTPILMCVYPHKYAVYNRVSEGSLMGLGMLKARPQGSFGTRYVQINEGCHQIANEINQPLSLVDTMLAKVFSLLPKDEEEEAAMARFGYEGRIKLRIHRDRERRPQLAKAKKADALKKYGKLACDVCTFVFEARYGEHGSKFIECHHIQPLSEIQETDGTKVTLGTHPGLFELPSDAPLGRLAANGRTSFTPDQPKLKFGRANPRFAMSSGGLNPSEFDTCPRWGANSTY